MAHLTRAQFLDWLFHLCRAVKVQSTLQSDGSGIKPSNNQPCLALHDTNKPVTQRHWLWEIFSMVARVSGITPRWPCLIMSLTVRDFLSWCWRKEQYYNVAGALAYSFDALWRSLWILDAVTQTGMAQTLWLSDPLWHFGQNRHGCASDQVTSQSVSGLKSQK